MENNEKQAVECIPTKETVQEFYGCFNDACPICEEKFIAPGNIYKLGNVIYHLNCYLDVRQNEL